MQAEIFTSLIASSGAIVLACASYWFTKKREREADLRKEKLTHYKEFTVSLSGTIAGESTPDGQRAFSCASNNLNLVAPIAVLKALQDYRHETRISNPNPPSLAKHDQLLSKLFWEIRKDLGVPSSESLDNFKIGLWSSGQSHDSG